VGEGFCAIECLRVHRTGRETHDSKEMSKRIVVTSDVTPCIIVRTSVSTKVGSSSLSSCDCKYIWACVYVCKRTRVCGVCKRKQ